MKDKVLRIIRKINESKTIWLFITGLAFLVAPLFMLDSKWGLFGVGIACIVLAYTTGGD